MPDGVRLDHFRQGDDHAPRLMAFGWVRSCTLPAAAAKARILGRSKWLFGLPSGAVAGVLTLDFEPRDGVSLVDAARAIIADVRDGGGLELDGARSPLQACIAMAPGAIRGALSEAVATVDSHRLVLVAPRPSEVVGEDGTVDRLAAGQLGSESGRPYRADFSPAQQPRAANRFDDQFVDVRPGITVAIGLETWRQIRMLFAVVETFGALAVLQGVRSNARAQLDHLRVPEREHKPDVAALREELAFRAERLTELQLDLSFGVESYLQPRLLFADLPLQDYHSTLLDLLQMQGAADATGRVLERLETALNGRRVHIDVEEREQDERRNRSWSAGALALASTAVPLGLILAYLGASISEVRSENSVFDSGYLVAYAVLFGVVLLGAVLAFVRVWRSGTRGERERQRVRGRLRKESA